MAVQTWIYEARKAAWNTPGDIKRQYGHASIISSKRVVFNICGNRFRLIVDVEYKVKAVYIIWFGPHSEYSRLDVINVNYEAKDYKK